MQRAYFLGGASPCGFETAFWQEQRGAYGIYLKGGPGTGKSTLMKKIADAFSGERISLYHCASDPHSLDAVVLEDRGIFAADATAPHESSTPLPFVTGELLDLAQGLRRDVLADAQAEIRRLYAENQALHGQVRKGLAGIAAMEDLIADAGASALLREKLHGYANRIGKRLFPRKTGTSGRLLHRQCCAITPAGRLTLLPPDFEVMLMQDAYFAAGEQLLADLAERAVQCGLTAEITRSQTRAQRPITHLVIPQLRLALIAAPQPPAEIPQTAVTVIRMQRFYQPEILRAHRALLRFCAKTASLTADRTTVLLADALRVHEALERHDSGALDPAFLDAQAEAVIAKIRTFAAK